MLRASILIVALIVAPALSAQTDASAAADKARAWLTNYFAQELEKPNPDSNVVASIVFALLKDPASSERETALLQRAAQHLTLDQGGIRCEAAADHLLTNRFLHEHGYDVDKLDSTTRDRCLKQGSVFALSNLMLASCRYQQFIEPPLAATAMERLLHAQRADGSFHEPSGYSNYYLTSHGLLALHACGAPSQRVELSKAYLKRSLRVFFQKGFLDGMAETLLFLRWTGEPEYLLQPLREDLIRQQNADGGLCFVHTPHCDSHWHATSLLLVLLTNFNAGA